MCKKWHSHSSSISEWIHCENKLTATASVWTNLILGCARRHDSHAMADQSGHVFPDWFAIPSRLSIIGGCNATLFNGRQTWVKRCFFGLLSFKILLSSALFCSLSLQLLNPNSSMNLILITLKCCVKTTCHPNKRTLVHRERPDRVRTGAMSSE